MDALIVAETVTSSTIRCDCCGVEGLGKMIYTANGLTLEIRARRHGVWHHLALTLEALAQYELSAYPLRTTDSPAT